MKLHDPVDGLLLIDKASGITSHDVVALVRRRLGAQKVGHCGTLDPLATGLLLIVVGKATKIQDLLMSEDKEYVGTMKLGEITDSQDCDGQVIEQRSVEAIDPADGLGHKERWRPTLQVSQTRQGRRSRGTLRACLRPRDPSDSFT